MSAIHEEHHERRERLLAAVGRSAPADAAGAAPPLQAPPTSARRRRVRLVAALLALLLLAAGGRMWWHAQTFVDTENAYVAGHVHPISARVVGVVAAVRVSDNQEVKAGELLAELDATDQRLKVEQITAQIAAAEQQALQARAQIAQARAQVGHASALVQQADAQLARAEQDAARYADLNTAQMRAVSRAEVEAAAAQLAAARAERAGRREVSSAAQAQVAAAQAAREVIEAQVAVLRVQLKDAQQQLAYNRIVAPVDGRVGRRSIELGMRVQPGQQLAAIVQGDFWVVANFKETQVADIQVGQAASVLVDALPGRPLKGRVDSLAPASGAQFALLPPDNATGNFTKIVQRVPVKITFGPQEVNALRGRLVPGMSAVVEIRREPPPAPAAAGR